MVSILSGGLTYVYLDNINSKQIKDINEEIKKLFQENESLRKEVKLDGNIKHTIKKLDKCLINLSDNIINNINTIDDRLKDEIKQLCSSIINALSVKEKIEPEYENDTIIKNINKSDSESSLSNDSYDKLCDELNKVKED
jgi:hypothetical protein